MTRYPVVEKTRFAVPPNLADYEVAAERFTWDQAREELDGLPSKAGLNMAHEAVDRHARGRRRDRVALRCIAKDGSVRDMTYGALAEATSRFANAQKALGIGKADRVFALLPRIQELYVACLGTLKNGSVFSPLFSAFGPEPIARVSRRVRARSSSRPKPATA